MNIDKAVANEIVKAVIPLELRVYDSDGDLSEALIGHPAAEPYGVRGSNLPGRLLIMSGTNGFIGQVLAKPEKAQCIVTYYTPNGDMDDTYSLEAPDSLDAIRQHVWDLFRGT